MTGARSRVSRLLALVPYLVAHPGERVADVAATFGVSERQLRDDLELLFVCGLPGYTPGDLIDVTFQGDRVIVTNADTIARPLRLAPDEALSLVAALRSLTDVPGLAEHDALDRALAKLEAVCAPALPAAPAVTVTLEPEGEVLALVESALASTRRLHLRYHSAGRDAVTERDVDPMRVVSADGRWYLEAWCRRVEDVRLFRLDRVLSATVLDVPAEVPDQARSRDIDDGVFRPDERMPEIVLELEPAARWVADYYPCESLDELPDGALRVRMRAADTRWLVRLLLQLGRHGRVVSPATLADEVRAEANAALAAYGRT